jgi:hypothetical protein
MDYYSSWPEAIIIKDTTSETIIEKLSEIFARYGFPETVLTGNDQQFISAKIEKNSLMLVHVLSVPAQVIRRVMRS